MHAVIWFEFRSSGERIRGRVLVTWLVMDLVVIACQEPNQRICQRGFEKYSRVLWSVRIWGPLKPVSPVLKSIVGASLSEIPKFRSRNLVNRSVKIAFILCGISKVVAVQLAILALMWC